MELSKDAVDRALLARTAFAVVLTVAAVRSLQQGKRLRGALAGAGALALGYLATAESEGLTGIRESADEEVELRCATCGQPIRPGQARGPNENDEIVHDDCKATAR
jgi:hypothetical protein